MSRLGYQYLLAFSYILLSCSNQQSKADKSEVALNLRAIDKANKSTATDQIDSALVIDNLSLKKIITEHYKITGPSFKYQNDEQFSGYLFDMVKSRPDSYPYINSPGLDIVLNNVLSDSLLIESDIDESLFNKRIEKIVGIIPIIKMSPIKYLNHRFVEWGINNLIPDPTDSLAEHSFQDIYGFYAEHFRLYYLTMRWLEGSSQKLDEELKAYKQAIEKDSLCGGQFLTERYKHIQFRDVVFSQLFDESIAIGFWLRRHWDGSYDAFKNGLIFIMKNYDKKYLDDEIPIRKKIRISLTEGLDPSEYVNDSVYVLFNELEVILEGLIPNDDVANIYFKPQDTLLLHVQQYLGVFGGELKSINILKRQSCTNISVKIMGQKTLFYQFEEGKGGVGAHDEFPMLKSEDITLVPIERVLFKIPDIFNDTKFKWNPYSKDQMKMIDTLPQFRDGTILPHSLFLKIKCQNLESTWEKERVIHLLYGYGD